MGRKIINSVGVVVTDNDFNIKYISSSAAKYVSGDNLLAYFKGHPFSEKLSDKKDFTNEKLRIYRSGMCYDMYCSGEFGDLFCFSFGGAVETKSTYFSYREDFESIISEMRSRMVMIDTCVNLMLRAPEQVTGKVASTAKTGIVQIMKIITSCDGIIKSEDGRGEPHKEEFDIAEMITKLADGIFGYMNGKYVRFSFRGRKNQLVYADYYQIQKAVMNIISCMLANDSGTSLIDIDVSASKTKAVIRLINNSMSAPFESVKCMYDRVKSGGIYRNAASVYEMELSYAEKCIELNGGTMCAEEINGGVCFIIELPLENTSDSLCSGVVHTMPQLDAQFFDIREMRSGDLNGED